MREPRKKATKMKAKPTLARAFVTHRHVSFPLSRVVYICRRASLDQHARVMTRVRASAAAVAAALYTRARSKFSVMKFFGTVSLSRQRKWRERSDGFEKRGWGKVFFYFRKEVNVLITAGWNYRICYCLHSKKRNIWVSMRDNVGMIFVIF